MPHARTALEAWRREDNEERPKKSLGGLTPATLTQSSWPIATLQCPEYSNANRYSKRGTSAMVDLGVLGLVLYLRIYVLAWRGLGRARTRLIARKDVSDGQGDQIIFARAIQLSLTGNAVAGFLLSMTYATVLWVTFGRSMALVSFVDRLPQES